MADIDLNDSFALDYDRLPDADHEALIALGAKLAAAALATDDDKSESEKLRGAATTLYGYVYAHRCLTASVAADQPELLRTAGVAARYTPATISWMLASWQERVSARSMATLARSLIGFAKHSVPDADIAFVRKAAQAYEASAKTQKSTKRRYAIARDETPAQFQHHYDLLAATGKSATYNTGEFLRYLGAQKRAGVDIQAIDASFLTSPAAIANFETALPAGKTPAQRINAAACLLQIAELDARPLFDRACAIRKAASKNPGLHERRAVAFEALPEEAQRRFDFVTTYDGQASFAFDGRTIILPKARRNDKKEFSDTYIDAMRRALRHHFTILRDLGSPLAEDVQRWGERDAMDAFQAFFAESHFKTQTSRLEELVAALRSIYGDADRRLFQRERRQLQDMKALQALLDDGEPGLNLREVGRPEGVSEADAVDPPSTKRLAARARAIAWKALKRLRDLKSSPLPYRDPSRLAGLFRTALIVALLAEKPPRLRSLQAMQKSHLKKPEPLKFTAAPAPAPRYDITIPGLYTKSGKPFKHTCSLGLTRLFDALFAEVDGVLLNGRPNVAALFISDEGKALCRSAFQTGLPKFTAAFFRYRMYPHLARKLHGTELIGDREAAARRLQHGDFASQLYYQDKAALRDCDRVTSLSWQSEGFFPRR